MRKLILGLMITGVAFATQAPNVSFIKQNIASGDITVTKAYEKMTYPKKKMSAEVKELLKVMADADIHIVRVGQKIQFIIPTNSLFVGLSEKLRDPDKKVLNALKTLVQHGDKMDVRLYALAKKKNDAYRVVEQAQYLLGQLGQIEELKTTTAIILRGSLDPSKDLPFWQSEDPDTLWEVITEVTDEFGRAVFLDPNIITTNSKLICIEYQLKAGQQFLIS